MNGLSLGSRTRIGIRWWAPRRTDRHISSHAYAWRDKLRTRRLAAVRSATSTSLSSLPRLYFSRGCITYAGDATIYALSSASGRAAVAIVRISGPACLIIYQALCSGKAAPKPRVASVRTIYEPNSDGNRDALLDPSALVLYFPGPATLTGEDVLEFHVHGGPAVVKAVLAAIPKCTKAGSSQIRYAEPGEFTRRAFMNGRFDLTQVEALGDILAADTEQQRRLSVRGTTTSLGVRYEEWRQLLLHARGELEALIDFSEDQHFDETPAQLCNSVATQVSRLKDMLEIHSQNAVRGEMLRHGISISFLGAPNTGKSSLLNRIVGREAAIVSHEAGTTRDVVEVGLDMGGYFCRLADTAGLRQAKAAAEMDGQSVEVINRIEEEGMRRAKDRAAGSDVVVVVFSIELIDDRPTLCLDAEVCATAARLLQERDNVIVIVNKADLARDVVDQDTARETVLKAMPDLGAHRIHLVSCIDAASNDQGASEAASMQSDPGGIQAFLHGLIGQFTRLTAAVTPTHAAADPDPSIWRESLGASQRHRHLLDACISHLHAFLTAVKPSAEESSIADAGTGEADIVVAAEHLRSAADCLARITGTGITGDVEEVLGVVFEKFCVGK